MPGWSDFDEIEQGNLPPDSSRDPDLVDKLYVEVFNTPAGQKLLAFWRHTKLDQPVCVPGAGAEVGFFREGENTLVRECMQRLIRGLTPKT